MQSSDWKAIVENITPQSEPEAREVLSEALRNYIMQALESQDASIPLSSFACLITCQYVCAAKSGEKCISQLLKENGAVRVLHGAATLGRLLNAERKLTLC